jgi:hypothetical protein
MGLLGVSSRTEADMATSLHLPHKIQGNRHEEASMGIDVCIVFKLRALTTLTIM